MTQIPKTSALLCSAQNSANKRCRDGLKPRNACKALADAPLLTGRKNESRLASNFWLRKLGMDLMS